MKPTRQVGILGYGAYVPRHRLPAAEVNRIWHGGQASMPIHEKAVPGPDEDAVTMAIEAGRNAFDRASVDPVDVRAVWIGSESHPYAVKPTSTLVAEALGVGPSTLAADWEFACKAGSEAMQAAIAIVGSGMGDYALAAGVDTAQGRPGDALEFTAGAGGAAYLIGPAEGSLAELLGSYSHVSEIPDFWRRPMHHYPRHGGRFTGQPAYFEHSRAAARTILEELALEPADVHHVVFHQPNLAFPSRMAREFGFTREQTQAGLLVNRIGNAYAGSSLLGLSAVLDQARPGQLVLQVSFGSGAGSDAFCWRITERIVERRNLAPTTGAYVARRHEIDYGTYVRYRNKLVMD